MEPEARKHHVKPMKDTKYHFKRWNIWQLGVPESNKGKGPVEKTMKKFPKTEGRPEFSKLERA